MDERRHYYSPYAVVVRGGGDDGGGLKGANVRRGKNKHKLDCRVHPHRNLIRSVSMNCNNRKLFRFNSQNDNDKGI